MEQNAKHYELLMRHKGIFSSCFYKQIFKCVISQAEFQHIGSETKRNGMKAEQKRTTLAFLLEFCSSINDRVVKQSFNENEREIFIETY